jgi:hypothetical protein
VIKEVSLRLQNRGIRLLRYWGLVLILSFVFGGFSEKSFGQNCAECESVETCLAKGAPGGDENTSPATPDPITNPNPEPTSLPGSDPAAVDPNRTGFNSTPNKDLRTVFKEYRKFKLFMICISGTEAKASEADATVSCTAIYNQCMQKCQADAATKPTPAPAKMPATPAIPVVCTSAASKALAACSENQQVLQTSAASSTGSSSSSSGTSSSNFSQNSCDQLNNLNNTGNSYASNVTLLCSQAIQNCQTECLPSANTNQCTPAVTALSTFSTNASQLSLNTTSAMNGCSNTNDQLSNSGQTTPSSSGSSGSGPSSSTPSAVAGSSSSGGGGSETAGSNAPSPAGDGASIANMIANPTQSTSSDTKSESSATASGSGVGGSPGSGVSALKGGGGSSSSLAGGKSSFGDSSVDDAKSADPNSQATLASEGRRGSSGSGVRFSRSSVMSALSGKVSSVFGQKYSKQQLPDFNKFKPNMPYNPRDPASASRSDGITGPHTSLFEKIRVQYSQQTQKGKFLTD